jgi:hypothetical protein
MPFSYTISFAKSLRQGSWQWQSLAHRIDLLLPPTTTSPTPTPTTPFDTITHWLPTICLIKSPTSATNDPTADNTIHHPDNTPPDADHPHTTDDIFLDYIDHKADGVPPSPTDPHQHPLPIIRPIIPSHPPSFTMDISKPYTQNAHGLWCQQPDCDGNIIANCERNLTTLEHLVHCMRVDDIDAWFVQETWLEDDDFNTAIGDYHLFRHNSLIGTTEHDHLFRGVAIIFSPRYFLAWRTAGLPPPITTGSTGDFAGQFIGLNLKFDCFNSFGRRVKGKSLSIFLASVYHPCHDASHEQFLKHLTSILQRVPKTSKLIIGADINAKVGRRNCEEFKVVLGPHDPPRHNTPGSNLLSIYLSHKLRVKNTFFDAPTHTTFTNIKDGDWTMIYIFAFAKQLHCRICNCRRVADGVESDHDAVCLDTLLTSLKRADSTKLT